MPRSAYRAIVLAFCHAALSATCMAQQSGITADLHPWGRFDPGAWKLVRVVTETLNEQGEVVSTNTTDTKTTLMKIDEDGVTLEVQACMEVAGKSFQAEPQVVRQGFNGELASPDLKAKEPTDGRVVIEERKIACKVHQLEVLAANEKTSISIYYSSTVAPYILKRVSVTTDPDGEKVLSKTNFEVIAVEMPIRLRGETRSGAYVRTVHKNTSGTTTTLAVVLPDVPGGVFSHSSKEVDKSGRMVRRSTLELVDYGAEPEEDRVGFFRSRRAARRAARAYSRRGK